MSKIEPSVTEGDYFFIAETLQGKKFGTVGIYDIKEKVGHFGRLLMIGNPFQTFEAQDIDDERDWKLAEIKYAMGNGEISEERFV